MKKPHFNFTGLVACTLVSLACCHKDPDNVQMLINTDLEVGGSQPNAWIAGSNSSGSLEWTMEEAVSAKHSLKINQTTTTGSSYWMQICNHDIPLGRHLIFSAKINGKNITGMGVALDIRVDNTVPGIGAGSQYANSHKTVIAGDFDWTTYTVKLSNLNKDAKTITVFLSTLPNTTGTVYFDDISLVHN